MGSSPLSVTAVDPLVRERRHVTIPTQLIEKRARRFSPAGLALSPHHRALWDVRLLPACTETGQILLSRCGDADCGPTAWTATLGIDRCEHCMADLAQAQTTSVLETTRASLASFAGLFSHDAAVLHATLSMLPVAIAGLEVADIIDLLVRLLPVVDNQLPLALHTLLNSDPALLANAVATAWRAIAGWPDGLDRVLAPLVASRTGRHNDGNRSRTMRLLSRKHQSSASAGVVNLIADWRSSVSVNKEGGRKLRDRTASINEVAVVTGLDTSKVVEHRRAGVFTVHFALDLGRPEARFDRTELEGIACALADRTSIGGARNILGMSCHGVEQLAAMRLIELAEHPYFDRHYGGPQVSTTALEALIEAVRSTASPRVVRPVALRTAMKTVGGRAKPWGEIVNMLVTGQLPFSLSPEDVPLTEAIHIDHASVPMLQTVVVPDRILPALSPFMSKADAGEMLNLAPAKATLLLAHLETGVGSHQKAVPLELAGRLARRHMSVAEIAARRGVHPLRAQIDAISAEVPFLGAGGFCRVTAERKVFGG